MIETKNATNIEFKTIQLQNQFEIHGFSQPFRLDKNITSGGVMIFIRDSILATQLNDFVVHRDLEGIFVELNFKGKKWLLFGTYRNPKQSHDFYFSQVSKALDFYSEKYENFLLVGDFNFEIKDKPLKDFLINRNPLILSCVLRALHFSLLFCNIR